MLPGLHLGTTAVFGLTAAILWQIQCLWRECGIAVAAAAAAVEVAEEVAV